MNLFLSFDGRIGRKGFWLGLLSVIGLALVASYIAGALGPGSAAAQISQLILSAGIAWVWAAVLVKRLHDRNKPALPWVAIFLAPGLVLSVIATFQIVTPVGPIVETREVSRAYYDAVLDEARIPLHYLPDRPAKHYVDPASLGRTQFWAGLLAVVFGGLALSYGRIRTAQLRKSAAA